MSALLVSDVILVAIVSVFEGVASHPCVCLHVSTPSLSDRGSVDHTVCQALPLDRALARARERKIGIEGWMKAEGGKTPYSTR